MNNLPDGPGLLRIARAALEAELKPLATGDARYTLAMISNAMAIAAREAERGERDALEALSRLGHLYSETPNELHGAALVEAIAAYERRLAADIRAGAFDESGERRSAMLEHLRESTKARLAVSNPKYLDPGVRRDDERA
jgi:hypothetical protein